MARYTHMPTFVAEQFLFQVSHIGHVLSGHREKTQLQPLWLDHHLTEEFIMGEGRESVLMPEEVEQG